jgi:hypothetical protein
VYFSGQITLQCHIILTAIQVHSLRHQPHNEAEPPTRIEAHNRHTERRGDQVLSGFERGVIDPGVSVALAAVRRGRK